MFLNELKLDIQLLQKYEAFFDRSRQGKQNLLINKTFYHMYRTKKLINM